MKAPIIANNHGDLLLFKTVERAREYLEPLDVLNDEYVLYDSEGRLLRAVAKSDRGPIEILEAESSPMHKEILQHDIVHFLQRVGEPRSALEGCSLDERVLIAIRYPTG